MGTGISAIVKANKRGGFHKTVGNQWIMDVIAVGLMDGQSHNPFQKVGISEGIIFENPDSEMWIDLENQIKELFERLEDDELAKLQDRADNLQPFRTADSQYGMKIYFINLEQNTPAEGMLAAGSNGFYGELLQ